MDRLLRFDDEGDPGVDPDPHAAVAAGDGVASAQDLAAFGQGHTQDASGGGDAAPEFDAAASDVPTDPSDGSWHVFWGRPDDGALDFADDLSTTELPFGAEESDGVGDAVPAHELDSDPADDPAPVVGDDAMDTGSV